jgi:hypothetical protein
MDVISNAQKIVLGVPEAPEGSTPAVFPRDATISDYGQDNHNPLIVVCNSTEQTPSWQGANAEGYVIINSVPFQLAKRLLGVLGPEYTLDQLRSLVELMAELGYSDQYTTNNFGLFTNAGVCLGDRGGFMTRSEKDICTLTSVEGRLMILQPGETVPKVIQSDILQRDYRLSDGGPITEEILSCVS